MNRTAPFHWREKSNGHMQCQIFLAIPGEWLQVSSCIFSITFVDILAWCTCYMDLQFLICTRTYYFWFVISIYYCINTSNYARNISYIIIRNTNSTSNYASNRSNVLLSAFNISNINSSKNANNISNSLLTTFNINNINSSKCKQYNKRFVNTFNISNINSSNYASNISNVLWTTIILVILLQVIMHLYTSIHWYIPRLPVYILVYTKCVQNQGHLWFHTLG